MTKIPLVRTHTVTLAVGPPIVLGVDWITFLLVQGYSAIISSLLFWIFFCIWMIYGFAGVWYAGTAENKQRERNRYNAIMGVFAILLIASYEIGRTNPAIMLFAMAFIGIYNGIAVLGLFVLAYRLAKGGKQAPSARAKSN